MKIMAVIVVLVLAVAILVSQLPNTSPVWIDVRSLQEYKIDNIEGDIQIAHTEIVQQVSRIFPDKETQIRLYCRSGRRAGVALSALKRAGYSSVENVGSIGNARKVRNITK